MLGAFRKNHTFAFVRVIVLEHHRDAGGNKDRKLPFWRRKLYPLCSTTSSNRSDYSAKPRKISIVVQANFAVPVGQFFSQMISLSVYGALGGAGVGTSDSTERDQAPDFPEMKVPSAVAAAEGDETNNPKR